MTNQVKKPDWADIQNKFRHYIAAFNAGDPRPVGRDQLFAAIYGAVEYLAVVHYRKAAGIKTGQTELMTEGVVRRVWKIDWERSSTATDRAADDRECAIPQDDAPQEKLQKKQRTFTSLMTQDYKQKASPHTFLSTVVRNALFDWFDEQNRINKVSVTMDEDLYEKIIEIGLSDRPVDSMHQEWGAADHSRSPEDQAEWNQTKATLAKMISTLSLRDQQLLHGIYVQDLTYEEISEISGVNASTLRTRASRALQRMRANMAKQ